MAVATTALWMWTILDRAAASGFALELIAHEGGTERHIRTPDLDPIRARRLAPALPATARWKGWWSQTAEGALELIVAARSPTRVLIDGTAVIDHDGRPRRLTAPVALAAGTHEIVVEHELGAEESDLRVALSRPGGDARRVDTLPMRHTATPPPLDRIRPWAGVGTLLSTLGLLAALVAVWGAAGPEAQARVAQGLLHGAAVLITAYGALLRIEALALKYDAPPWMSSVVPIAQDLHPRGMKWLPPEHPYQGDPFSYLRLARDMRWFYEASVREPLYVAVANRVLRLMGDRDVAVSVTSALFSILLVPATYLLGVVAFSPPVGLMAAAAIAVERQIIGLGVDGWRDDAFALFVVLSAAALLRLRDRPAWSTSLPAGLAMGLALLTRITSLSFVLPALALIAWKGEGPRDVRLRHAAVAGALALLLLAPFLVTCALEYGDPLYSINAHTRFYRSRAAGTDAAATGWATMLAERGGPITLVDTGLVGLTAYPFTSKWTHFDYLGGWIGSTLAAAAVVGLGLWLLLAQGRLLLLVLLGALLPFAFTWEVPGGSEWRFTLHAYPFYLLAAASAPWLTAGLIRGGRPRLRVVGAVLAAAALAYVAVCGLAYARVREELGGGREARIVVGPRDLFFFGDGWSRPTRIGHLLVRHGDAGGAFLRLPLRAGRGYRLALRLDPEGLGARAAFTLNGTLLTELDLLRDDVRVARYEVDIPAARVRPGANELRIHGSGPFRLWLVQVAPLSDSGPPPGS